MRGYARWLRAHHWPVINNIRDTGQPTDTGDDDMALRQLLESRAVLVYRNDNEWYDLNPALDKIPDPAALVSAS